MSRATLGEGARGGEAPEVDDKHGAVVHDAAKVSALAAHGASGQVVYVLESPVHKIVCKRAGRKLYRLK